MWTRRALALAAGCLVALLLVEGAFRAAGLRPPTPEELVEAEVEPVRFHRERESNSLGYHDREWALEKPEGTWRIAFLGDSFTENILVPLEDVFVERIERALNAERPGGLAYECMNVARGGWGTWAEERALTRILPYAPDAVVVVYFVNDATSMKSNPLLSAAQARSLEGRDGLLNRVSAAWDWLDWRRRRRELTQRTLESYLEAFEEGKRGPARWRESRSALAAIAATARSARVPVALAVFPVLARLDGEHPLAPLYDNVLAASRELGIPAASLLPAFLGREASSLWVSRTNAHPNAEANRIAAEALLPFLRDAGIVPR